mgnify:FL=1|jgi:predicted nucleic acid-binding protein
MAWYLDTSAAVKLVVAEQGSTGLRRWLAEPGRDVVSGDLLRTELLRTVRRGAPEQVGQARAVLDAMPLLNLTPAVCERAGSLEPVVPRSLDALHLATALELGDDLDGIVTYDERLGDAARILGYAVVAPQ